MRPANIWVVAQAVHRHTRLHLASISAPPAAFLHRSFSAASNRPPHPPQPQPPADAGRLRFHIRGAGCAITIRSPHHTTPVAITFGDPDAVEVWWIGRGEGETTPPSPPPQASQEGSAISITATPAASSLHVAIPSRYASLDIATGGGSVSVAGLAEARLEVRSSGGAVTLGDARCTGAAVHTGGGPLTAGTLSGDDVRVSSHGGAVSIGRLVARAGRVESGGGDLRLGAALGDVLALSSGAGALSVRSLHARALATVSSSVGPITLDGVDGCADVTLAGPGGALSIHLLGGLGAVRAAAPGGVISAAVDPAVLGGWAAPATGGMGAVVTLGGEGESSGSGSGPGLSPFSTSSLLEARWSAAAAAAAAAAGDPPAPSHTPGIAEDEAALVAVLRSAGRGGRGGMRDEGGEAGAAGHQRPPLALLDTRPGGQVTVRAASWFEGAMERAAAAGRVGGGGGS